MNTRGWSARWWVFDLGGGFGCLTVRDDHEESGYYQVIDLDVFCGFFSRCYHL